MSYMSKSQFDKEMADIQRDNISKERKILLKEEKNKYSKRFKLPSTSKLLLWTAVALSVEILIFCQAAFVMTRDTSFLYVLAGVPTTLVPTILSYYNKSKCENTTGGIVYETAMNEIYNEDSVG